jgi:dienelactone hydrolase
MFGDPEPRPPFDRSPMNGFRCVKYTGDGQPDARAAAPWDRTTRNFRAEASVPDETFAQFVRMHQYAPTPLNARVEKTIDTAAETRVERVSFAAAYGNERVIAYLWLPKQRQAPYQTVVIFPGAEGFRPSGSEVLEQPDRYDFLVRSGRAVVHPVYHGTYERFTPRPADPIAFREYAVRWFKDFRRTIDYLESRSDIDRSKIAYFGGSLGASIAPIALALDRRVSLAILVGGGLTSFRQEPEVEAIHYAPRVTQPVLLLCGRHDFFFPYETSQKPFFERLGTAPEHKRHVTVEASHAVPRSEYLREMLGWLDQYYGSAQ